MVLPFVPQYSWIKNLFVAVNQYYGPRHQMEHPRQGVLNWFVRQLIDGKTVELFGNACQIRDVNFVSDVVSAFMLAADSPKSDGEVLIWAEMQFHWKNL